MSDPAARIRNWHTFQHYKYGSPKWIKLHKILLDNPDFHALSGDDAKALIYLWLIASERDGDLPPLEVLSFRLRTSKDNLATILKSLEDNGFVENSSAALEQLYSDSRDSLEQSRVEQSREPICSERAVYVYPEPFEIVWAIHHRGSKKKALDAYRKAVSNGTSHEEVMGALKAYTKTLRDGFLGVHLFRWFNEERWQEQDNVWRDNPNGVPLPGGGFYVGG